MSRICYLHLEISTRPEPFNQDFSKYDFVFVGSPIWSWTHATATRTLFEKVHLIGKKVYFLTTSKGSNRGVKAKAKQRGTRKNQWMGYHDFLNVIKNKNARIEDTRVWLKWWQ